MVSQLFVTVEKCPRSSQINDQINNVGLGRISLELHLSLAPNPDLLVIFPHHSLCSVAPQGCLRQPVFSMLTPKQQNTRQQWECHFKKKTALQYNFRLASMFLCCHTTVLGTLGRGAAGWMMARGFPRSSVTLSLE